MSAPSLTPNRDRVLAEHETAEAAFLAMVPADASAETVLLNEAQFAFQRALNLTLADGRDRGLSHEQGCHAAGVGIAIAVSSLVRSMFNTSEPAEVMDVGSRLVALAMNFAMQTPAVVKDVPLQTQRGGRA